MVSAFAVMGLVGTCVLAGAHLVWLDAPAWHAVVPALAAVANLAVPLALLRWKALRWSGHLCVASWLLVTSWGLVIRGGLMAPPLMCLGAPPLIATALLGRRAGLAWVVPVAAEFLILLVLGLIGVSIPDQLPPEFQARSNMLAAALFGGLLVAMSQAQEWLRATASEEHGEVERRKLEAEREIERERADRLASLGQLAAGVAHELSNPLTYLQSNLELLEERPQSAEDSASVQAALEATSRIKVIIRDLKEYSRFDDELGPVALDRVVGAGLRIAGGELKRVAVRTRLDSCPLVHANEVRLGQVLVNLLVNASQAGAKEISVCTLTDAGGNAVLEVRDTGQGIPAHLLRRVKDPFFTTKPAGVGTGLGLAVCDRLVRQLGGVMSIESAVGVGTTVTIVLPPASVEAEARAGR